LYFNGIGSYPNTAALYMDGGTVETRSSMATVTSSQIIWASGRTFDDSVDRVTIAGSIYYVSYVDSTHYNIVSGPGTTFGTPVSISATNSIYSYGLLFQGDTATGDGDVLLSTASKTSIRINGKHYIGIDTSQDQTKYALVTGVNQLTCFNALDGCFTYNGGNTLRYNQGGGTAMEVIGGAANGVQVQAAPSGFGPFVRAIGGDPNIPLNLAGKGASPVQVTGGLAVSTTITAPALPTSAGTTKGSLCVDTSGNVFVKTTSGPCL
jgi:hypothetical protein